MCDRAMRGATPAATRSAMALSTTGALTVAVLVAVLVALLLPSRTLAQAGAQKESDRLRAAIARAKVADSAAAARFGRRFNATRGVTDTSIIRSGPITLRVIPPVITDGERERLESALASARDTLRARFGDAGDQMLDTVPWTLRGRAGRLARFRPLALRAGGRINAFGGATLVRPIRSETVEAALLRHAGANLPRVVPKLDRLVGRTVSFANDAEEFSFAARELALSASSPARRCRMGSFVDCRRVLDPDTSATRLERWYEPQDHRQVVTQQRPAVASQDTAGKSSWQRCVDGADSACTRLVGVLPVRDPISAIVRGTLVRHALDAGAPGTLARLEADTTGGLVAMLARAAHVPEDSLLSGWHHRIQGAGEREDIGNVPLALAAATWSLILLAFSIRRKPA